ncbi:MAG: hypothetical protein ACWA45_10340 [Flavobacteriales bacterium]
MKYFIFILFITICLTLGYGFYIKPQDTKTGDLIIGLSLVVGFFIVMPLFIYYRWKDKKVEDYMLNKENILKMKAFNDEKDKKNS